MRSNLKMWYVRLTTNPKVLPGRSATSDVAVNANTAMEAAEFAQLMHITGFAYSLDGSRDQAHSVVIAISVWSEYGVLQEIDYDLLHAPVLTKPK